MGEKYKIKEKIFERQIRPLKHSNNKSWEK